jgi:hypothetical protein
MNPRIVAALVLVAGLFMVCAIAYGGGDGDLWWQRQLGETVLRTHALPTTLGAATLSAPQAHWIPHEWIFAVAWAVASHGDADMLFRIACAALALMTIVIENARSHAAATRARMLMLVLVAVALTPSFGLRAQVLGWPLLAGVMLALEGGPRRAWFALPLTVGWFNLHASAVVVPCVVFVYAVGCGLETRRLRAFAAYLPVAAACALAACATPFGAELPRFALAWSANPATALVYEWLPAAPDKILIVAGVLAIAGLLVVGELRGARLTWPQRLLAAGLFAAAMLHIRNLGLFAIVAGPWTASALSALLPRERPAAERVWHRDGGLALAATAAAVLLVVVRARLPVVPGAVTPAVAQLAGRPGPLRVACEDFSWCSRFAADRRVRVFLDGRVDAYPDAVFADYRRMLSGDALPVFARWQIDAAVVHAHGPLARALRKAGWTLLRREEPQVYVRPPRAARRQWAQFGRLGGILAGKID